MSYRQRLIDHGFTSQDINLLQEEIKLSLGDGLVSVELTDDQLCLAIWKAKLWFDRRFGIVRPYIAPINYTATSAYVELPEYTESVAFVYFPPFQTTDAMFFFSPLLYLFYLGVPYGLLGYGSAPLSYFQQFIMYVGDALKVVGAYQNFWYDRARKILWIRTAGAERGAYVRVDIQTKLWTYSELESRLQYYVLNWALAEAMLILSRIRGKFSSIPGAQEALSLDAERLAEDAKTMMAELEQKSAGDTGAYPIILG